MGALLALLDCFDDTICEAVIVCVAVVAQEIDQCFGQSAIRSVVRLLLPSLRWLPILLCVWPVCLCGGRGLPLLQCLQECICQGCLRGS